MKKIVINSKAEMIDFAREIAHNAQAGETIGLKGTLGAGKSFFARNFINALSYKEETVASPTFNLVFSYDSKKGEIFHFDLYRLKSAEELENIGFFDAIKNGISLVEWPEIAVQFLTKNYTEIFIKILSDEQREITITQF